MENEQQRKLWQQAFGDSDAFLDAFFALGYAPQRSACIYEGQTLVAAAYWLDMALPGRKLAYLYAVATDEQYRRRGYCHRLMEIIHQTLRQDGYDAAVLVPATAELEKLYAGMGYLPFGKLWHRTVAAEGNTRLMRLTAEEYQTRRRAYLPEGGIEPGLQMLRFLETQTAFYAGDGFVCCASDGFLPEYLGAAEKLPAVVAALGLDTAKVRLPGGEKDFAMYLPLTEKGNEKPTYFSLALD